MPRTQTFWLIALCLVTPAQYAAAAENLIDARLSRDTGGIFKLEVQDGVPIALGLAAGACALWQGSADKLGKTCWESAEAGVAGGIAAKALQLVFRRQPPSRTADANHWFSPHESGSFPSLHVSFTTAVVTPVILNYVQDDPWVAVLGALPIYEMVARIKSRDHWETDVLAGALLGFGIGAIEHYRNSPLVFSLLPGGAFVGFHKSF